MFMSLRRVAFLAYAFSFLSVYAAANHSLPDALRSFKNIKYHSSITQQGDFCGYWSILNAKSLMSLEKGSKNGVFIDGAINDHAGSLAVRFLPKNDVWLDSYEVDLFAQRVVLTPYLIIGRDARGFGPLYTDFVIGSIDPVKKYDDFLKNYKNKALIKEERFVLSFICNCDNKHWVTIMVIKAPQHKPRLLIMDSLNRPLDNTSAVVPFVTYVAGLFGIE